MRCPFLKEAHVKHCQAAPFRKMIVQSSEAAGAEICSSASYRDCPSARLPGEALPEAPRCPNLQESLVQFCSAAAITKYIPYSESLLSRCGTENHRYCELYLAMAHPPGRAAGEDCEAGCDEEASVDDLPVSSRVSYSPNHMWLDVSVDGTCHVGVDALFARVIGQADRISFVPSRGVFRPSAVITACGTDLQMIFPNPMLVTRTNDYLRAHPEKLVSHPYSLGWLFEGEIPADAPAKRRLCDGLVRGKAAIDWMRRELERVSRFVHERCTVTGLQGESLMMDGGTVRRGLMRSLNREEVLALFDEFFAFYTIWRK